MITRKLKMAAIAAALAAMPMIGAAASQPTVLNSCVKAFMADLSAKRSGTLKLRSSHYVGDTGTPGGNLAALSSTSELTLTARDAHDNHALARAICTVNSQGDVLELRAEPLSAYEPF
jgi:hypothetical protein